MSKRWDKEDQFVLDIMDMISAPVITYAPQWWSGGIPINLKDKITMERMMYAAMGKKEATNAEVVGYLNTASCEFPLSRDWYEVYMHCFSELFPEKSKQIDPDFNGLNDYQVSHLLNPLKQWIYKKRREIMKQRVRDSNREEKTEFTEYVEVKDETGQLSLFG